MSSKTGRATTPATDQPRETGPWGSAFAQLQKWDPKWAETCLKMTSNPWTGGVLQRKLVELIGVALNSAGTNLNPDGMRRHIRGALQAGATREEILLVLKMASVKSIDGCMLATPLLLARMSHKGGGGRRKAARSASGASSTSGNHRTGLSCGFARRPLPECIDFLSGQDRALPKSAGVPKFVWLLPSFQQRRAATCNCRCTWRNSSR